MVNIYHRQSEVKSYRYYYWLSNSFRKIFELALLCYNKKYYTTDTTKQIISTQIIMIFLPRCSSVCTKTYVILYALFLESFGNYLFENNWKIRKQLENYLDR